jgi:hypothetical protein
VRTDQVFEGRFKQVTTDYMAVYEACKSDQAWKVGSVSSYLLQELPSKRLFY